MNCKLRVSVCSVFIVSMSLHSEVNLREQSISIYEMQNELWYKYDFLFPRETALTFFLPYEKMTKDP